nr:hypothetical protein [Candidatus Hamiltonella defensa]
MEPKPSKIPAMGNTDTGSISDLPTFCRFANAFLNIIQEAPSNKKENQFLYVKMKIPF